MAPFVDRLAKQIAQRETIDQRGNRRFFLKRSGTVAADLVTGLAMAGRTVTDAEANTPDCCGVSAFSTSF